MESKYLEIVNIGGIDTVMNKKKDIPLGEFFWNRVWRRFVFEPKDDTFFSHDCLEFIAYHLKNKKPKGSESEGDNHGK